MPLLMMVMALMIVFGNAAYWKVRGLSVARNAAWSNRWPRTGFDEPAPNPWTPAQFSRRGAPDVAVLDDPGLQHPVVRGPLPNNFNVNGDLLDPSRGATEGHAKATRDPAMMPSLGSFTYDLEQGLIDDKFQYVQMEIPANVHRRIPFIYELPKTDASLSQAWVAAAQDVMSAPFKPDLAPLDHDEEIFSYYGYYPDFQPRLSRFCSLDLASAWGNQTRQLIGRIKGRRNPRVAGVPERMASFWISMYQSQLTPENAATLQPLIDTLRAFRAQVRNALDTPDGPVPPLAALSANAGSLAATTYGLIRNSPSQPPLRPIPAVLFNLLAPADKACCGQSPPDEELLRLLEASPDLEELLP